MHSWCHVMSFLGRGLLSLSAFLDYSIVSYHYEKHARVQEHCIISLWEACTCSGFCPDKCLAGTSVMQADQGHFCHLSLVHQFFRTQHGLLDRRVHDYMKKYQVLLHLPHPQRNPAAYKVYHLCFLWILTDFNCQPMMNGNTSNMFTI